MSPAVKPRQSIRQTLARNTVTGWLGHAINILSTLYLTPLIIHGLGASTYGLWILITQLTGYSGILDLGVRFTLTKHIAQANIDGDHDRIRRLLSTALAMTSAVAVVVMAIAMLVATFFGRWFGLDPSTHEQGSRALLIASLTTALGFPAGVFMAALAGQHRYDLLDALGIVSQLLRTVGTIWVLSQGGGIVSLAVVNLAASLFAYGGSLLFLRTRSEISLGPAAVSWSIARLLVSFSLYAFASTAGWYLIYATDLTLIGTMLSPVDVAHYGLAINILTVVMAAVSAFTRSLVPIAGELNARANVADTQRVYLLATRTTLLIALPCLAVLALAGPGLLRIWVGPGFSEASGGLLQLLALAYLPIIMNSAGQALALAVEARGRFVLFILFEGLTNLAMSLILVRLAGPVGVAVGTLIPAAIFQGVLWPKYLMAQFGLDPARFWRETLRPLVLPLALSALGFGIATLAAPPKCQLCILLPIACLGATFYAAAAFTCFTANERLVWAHRLRELAAVVRGT